MIFIFCLFPVGVSLLLILLFSILVIYLKKRSFVYDVEAAGNGGMLGDGLPELDLNMGHAEEVNADDNDDGCPGNAIENENYVRESVIDYWKQTY